MNPFLLLALKTHLLTNLDERHFVGKGPDNVDSLQSAQVFIGGLPPQNPQRESYPHVLIIPRQGHACQGETVVTVALVCGIYNPEPGDAEGAEMDMALLLSRIRQSLFPCVKCPLDSRYRLTEDAKGRLFFWEKTDAQPRPYMQATLMTHWRMKGLE